MFGGTIYLLYLCTDKNTYNGFNTSRESKKDYAHNRGLQITNTIMKKLILGALLLLSTIYLTSCSAEEINSNGCPTTYNGHNIITGPEGGCYYINSNGNKTYIDRNTPDEIIPPSVPPSTPPNVSYLVSTCNQLADAINGTRTCEDKYIVSVSPSNPYPGTPYSFRGFLLKLDGGGYYYIDNTNTKIYPKLPKL